MYLESLNHGKQDLKLFCINQGKLYILIMQMPDEVRSAPIHFTCKCPGWISQRVMTSLD